MIKQTQMDLLLQTSQDTALRAARLVKAACRRRPLLVWALPAATLPVSGLDVAAAQHILYTIRRSLPEDEQAVVQSWLHALQLAQVASDRCARCRCCTTYSGGWRHFNAHCLHTCHTPRCVLPACSRLRNAAGCPLHTHLSISLVICLLFCAVSCYLVKAASSLEHHAAALALLASPPQGRVTRQLPASIPRPWWVCCGCAGTTGCVPQATAAAAAAGSPQHPVCQ